MTPCACDAELFEKVRYLFEFECQFVGRPGVLLDGFANIIQSLDLHLNGASSSIPAARTNSPSAILNDADRDYAWAVGDRWLIDRDGDELDAYQMEPRLNDGGAEAELVLEDA